MPTSEYLVTHNTIQTIALVTSVFGRSTFRHEWSEKNKGRPKLSKSVRKSRQINSTIKKRGTARKLTETRLKNAEKGKTIREGRSEEGDKNGEKSRKGGGERKKERERERKVSFAKNNFFTSIDEAFHALTVLKRGWE
jgi:hypothetical protein